MAEQEENIKARDFHDRSYKFIFSFESVVEDFLRAFVHEPWVDDIDFSTLTDVSTEFIGPELEKSMVDKLWRVQYHENAAHLYILFEFQSNLDSNMAFRMYRYVFRLYDRLYANRSKKNKVILPLVLPVVLYNGRRKWSAHCSLTQMLESCAPLLSEYQPQQDYFLVDMINGGESVPLGKSVVGHMRHMERARTNEEIRSRFTQIEDTLFEWPDNLGKAINIWVWSRFSAKLGKRQSQDVVQKFDKELEMVTKEDVHAFYLEFREHLLQQHEEYLLEERIRQEEELRRQEEDLKRQEEDRKRVEKGVVMLTKRTDFTDDEISELFNITSAELREIKGKLLN